MSADIDEPFWRIFDGIANEVDLSVMEKRRKSRSGFQGEAITPELLAPDKVTKWMTENFEKACRLVYHVARGEFPKLDQPQGPYNPRNFDTRGY